MTKDRLVAFTDAVLAIIMTILVLDLDRPDTLTLGGFWGLRWSFFSYALSFFWLGSLWMGLNEIWEHAERIDNSVVWWTLVLLFLASFVPYTTSLVGDAFSGRLVQAVYGVNVTLMTLANIRLHTWLERANADVPELVVATSGYRRLLAPDITIKAIGLVACLLVWPPAMMLAVLVAAVYVYAHRLLLRKAPRAA